MKPRKEHGYLIRDAEPEDAKALAEVMISEIHWSRVRELGLRFNTVLHRAWVLSDHAVVVLAEKDGEVAGYGAALVDMKRFDRELKLRHGWRLGLLLLPKLVNPRHVRTVIRALTYFPEVPADDPDAEVVSMAVYHNHRRFGIGRLIFDGMIEGLRGKGAPALKIGHVDVHKETANAFWSGLGARYLRTENFYRDKEVNVYVYHID